MSTKLTTITTELTPIQSQVQSLAITSPDSLAIASELRSRAKALLKTITAEKESLTDPITASLKAIRAKYKPHEEALEGFLSTLDSKMIKYQTDLTNSQSEAELALSERIATGKGNLSLETAVERLSNLPTAEKTISTDTGSTTFIATPVFEVTDIALLPLSLHLPDLVQIRKDMLAGIHHNGVTYSIEQRPRNSRN